jgi:chromosome segregation ATPase
MTETETATSIANIVLDLPYEDPDGDKAILSRQFLRSQERIAALDAQVILLGASVASMQRQIDGLEAQVARKEATIETHVGLIRDMRSEIDGQEVEIARLKGALKPFAARVFNDNGDVTVQNRHEASDEAFVAAYFALRQARSALSGQPGESA